MNLKPRLVTFGIEIERSIPIPIPNQIYPWDKLKVGDSFFAPGKKIRSMSALARKASVKHGIKLTCRRAEGGVRIWRIA